MGKKTIHNADQLSIFEQVFNDLAKGGDRYLPIFNYIISHIFQIYNRYETISGHNASL